jgi:hypothetical protein
MERIQVASSHLRAVGFDPQMETLEVEFVSGGIYQYYGVPRPVYDELMGAASKGRFFNAYIRNGYPHTRLA